MISKSGYLSSSRACIVVVITGILLSTVVSCGGSEKCGLALFRVIKKVGDFRAATKTMIPVGYRPCWHQENKSVKRAKEKYA